MRDDPDGGAIGDSWPLSQSGGLAETGNGNRQQTRPGRRGRDRPVAGEDDITNSRDRDVRLLRLLGAMPFLDRIELSQVAGEANQRVYEEIADLEELGVVAWVKHGSSLLAPTRRYHLTRKGVEWLAANVAIAAGGLAGMDWYRSRALDAALRLPGDRTVGILRQGATTERTGFSKRTWRLREEGGPQTVLTLAPDEVRARHTRRLMAEFPGLALVALESDTVQAAPEDPIWLAPSGAAWLGLPDVLKRGVWRGGTPVEPPLAEIRYPEGIEVPETGLWGPDHLLPAMLRPGEKRVMDLLADWPWITARELQGLLGYRRCGCPSCWPAWWTAGWWSASWWVAVDAWDCRIGGWRRWPAGIEPRWAGCDGSGAWRQRMMRMMRVMRVMRASRSGGVGCRGGGAVCWLGTWSTPMRCTGSWPGCPAKPGSEATGRCSTTRRTGRPGTFGTGTG